MHTYTAKQIYPYIHNYIYPQLLTYIHNYRAKSATVVILLCVYIIGFRNSYTTTTTTTTTTNKSKHLHLVMWLLNAAF